MSIHANPVPDPGIASKTIFFNDKWNLNEKRHVPVPVLVTISIALAFYTFYAFRTSAI
jgi:hypothetical protein